MATTVDTLEERREARWQDEQRRVAELATLSANLSAATARFVELAWEFREIASSDDFAGWLGYRCGITGREAREYMRVAEALQELPAIRAAFSRGETTYTKVRALTRVATPATEERLLALAGALTASQLERALRVFRRITAAEARRTHELEFVDYHFEEDGSLYLRARLPAEDGTVLVKALEAARERVVRRRREERRAAVDRGIGVDAPVAAGSEQRRPLRVEALTELAGLAETALAVSDEYRVEPARLIVYVDAAALTSDARGRSELVEGPVISPETARRLGCDAEVVAQIERDGLPVSVGRSRRTIPPLLRRMLEARDGDTCRFPGCRHLQAHHRKHWAHGGETSLENLMLLCFHHHGWYTRADTPSRTTRRAGFAFGIVTGSSPRARRRDLHRETRRG